MKIRNSKPAKGQKLHTFIAVGGKPKDFNKVNNTESLRKSSKNKKK